MTKLTKLGTINKRIDVGLEGNDNVYIMSSSNCIRFNNDELQCLLSVLSVINSFSFDYDVMEWFALHRITLWEPVPPPAEVRIM